MQNTDMIDILERQEVIDKLVDKGYGELVEACWNNNRIRT